VEAGRTSPDLGKRTACQDIADGAELAEEAEQIQPFEAANEQLSVPARAHLRGDGLDEVGGLPTIRYV
jgi:hypothetical protein